MQRHAKVAATCLEASTRQIGQTVGVGLPGNERGKDRPAPHPHNVSQHPSELDVGVFESFLNPLNVPGDIFGTPRTGIFSIGATQAVSSALRLTNLRLAPERD